MKPCLNFSTKPPQIQPLDVNAWSQNAPKIDTHTWKSSSHSNVKNPGFLLHQNNVGMGQHQFDQFYSPPVSTSASDSRGAAIHHNTNGNNDHRENRVPVSSQSVDDMAPQSISFIGDEDSVDLITEHPPPPRSKNLMGRPNVIQHEQDLDLGKLNISSGKLTYRIPSPTRPSLNLNSFQVRVHLNLVAQILLNFMQIMHSNDIYYVFRNRMRLLTTNKKVFIYHLIIHIQNGQNHRCAQNDHPRKSAA